MKETDLRDLFLRGSLKEKRLSQILAFAGDGKLLDSSMASVQFREYLQTIPRDLISEHAEECMQEGFENSPQALQDIVNEIGRRLGLEVRHGLYRGKKGYPGHDGLWFGSQNNAFVVEVKTTDTYRINLGRIDGYRESLIESKKLDLDKAYILIVLGNLQTGDLEAQIRGSKQAWHTRIIGINALLKLLELREMMDNLDADRITQFLKPIEFTRLDALLDLVFWSAEEAKGTGAEIADEAPPMGANGVRDGSLEIIEKNTGFKVLRRTRTTAEIPTRGIGFFFSYSKTYKRRGSTYFWYKYAPNHNTFLKSLPRAFLIFICELPHDLIIIPYEDFAKWIPELHTTPPNPGDSESFYWHINIAVQKNQLLLALKAGGKRPDLSVYRNDFEVMLED